MTIEEIENVLPNGFHDAVICSIFVDYNAKKAIFDINVNISNANNESTAVFNSGKLFLSGLHYLALEPPDEAYLVDSVEQGLWIASSAPIPSSKDQKNTMGSFTHRFFINNWNSFIVLSAVDARFEVSVQRDPTPDLPLV